MTTTVSNTEKRNNVNNTEKKNKMKNFAWQGAKAVLDTVHTGTVVATKLTEKATVAIGTRLTEQTEEQILSAQRAVTNDRLELARIKREAYKAKLAELRAARSTQKED